MRLSKVGLLAALGCLLVGVAILAVPGIVQAGQATVTQAQPAQVDGVTVRFDGATFSVGDLAAFTGQPIEVWNDTDKVYSLRVELAVAGGSSAPPALYLPAVMNPNGVGLQADTPLSYDVDFGPGQVVRLTLRPAGNWSVTVVGADGQPVDGVVLFVGVTNPATPFPTPTLTPGATPSTTPAVTPGQTPQPTASVTPPSGSPTPAPTVRPGQVEWTLHKTADGAHPDGNEQQMMWLMNRARANPAQEGVWLATTALGDIAGARSYFQVDTALLQREFAGYAARPPAAFDARMYAGSLAHSLDLIARDAQDHNGQFERVAAAGFVCWGGRGNVFAYADNGLNAHGAFNIDWGGTEGGMQTGRGHRQAIMALDGNYTNVGIALVPDTNPATNVGPLVTTSNYCAADTWQPNHYNRFLVGTVWRDGDGDGLYDPGEGIGGVQVNPSAGTYYAVTGAAGGYAIPILAPGTYTVHFVVGGGVDQVVTVGDVSVLVDVVVK